MKSLKYFLAISLFAVLSVARGYACSGPYYLPKNYLMYRAVDPNDSEESPSDDRRENCLAWQRLTSVTIPLGDILQVVYKMSLEEYEAFYDTGEWKGRDDNRFARWIWQNDREIMDFLLLAKTNEEVRLRRNSRWYYPTMRIGARMTIEDIVDKALSNNSERLRDRYLLQAIRALFSLGRYDECVRLWDSEMSKYPQYNAMRKLAQPYIAGAEYRLGNAQKSIYYYAQLGDSGSIAYCAKTTSVQTIALMYKHNPTSKELEHLLHRTVAKMEVYADWSCSPEEQPERDKYRKELSDIALRIAHEGKVANPAVWYYSAAFLADMRGDAAEASRLLRFAEKAEGTAYVKESIAVMRIYLDAKTLPYDDKYERLLFAQLRWLDNKVRSNITTEVRDNTSEFRDLKINKSYYYWNDMLRRILLSEVCPRMVEAGDCVRAMQLANMADNRLLGLVNRVKTSRATARRSAMGGDVVMTLDDYRRSESHFNHFDYSNHFFKLIDTVGLDNTVAYCKRVKSPRSAFDSFLNARGYVDADYLNDIVGTQYLRNMRYADAERYLSAISSSFYGHLNVDLSQDPFEIVFGRCYLNGERGNFRLRFAREMKSLEQKIASASDPNEKAQAMVRYAIGLRNSFGFAWELTQYYFSAYNYADWLWSKEKKIAERRVDELVADACQMATDRELAARIQYDFCNFREVATKYYDTQMAKVVWGRCDNLVDHHAERQYR